jgi:ABC-type Fe3+ transport system permease subunit
MKSNALIEALRSLKARYRKNVIENRATRIMLWVQAALIAGLFLSNLLIQVSARYAISQIKAHPHQPATVNIVSLANCWLVGFWIFTIGLPIVVLILGISGILPGTHRRPRYDRVA